MALEELARRLLQAAKDGNDPEVATLMTSGAPFTTDWLGTSPLHLACKNGHQNTAEVLMRAGISKDARTKVDQTPLHVAAMKGHVPVVEMLLGHQANIDALDMLKMTPLHWAVERGQADMVKCLMKNGADVNCLNKFEKTALKTAQDRGDQVIAQLLRERPEQHTEPESALPYALRTSTANNELLGRGVSLSNIRPVETITVNKDIFTESSGSSTSVLATLAAMAEASTPLKSHSEMSSIGGGRPRGTRTFILTDAGKLALGIQPQAKSICTNKSCGTKNNSANSDPLRPAKKQKTDDVESLSETSLDILGAGDGSVDLFDSTVGHDIVTIVCGDNGEMILESNRDRLEERLNEARLETAERQLELKETEDHRNKLGKGYSKKRSPRKQSIETRNSDNITNNKEQG